jgi:hypothetical protein
MHDNSQICMYGKAVPSFINIGAAKCGTSTLSELADAGGALPFAGVKEPKAFGPGNEALTDTVNAADKKAFAEHSKFGCSEKKTLYDMSPDYMSIPGMPRRMRQIYGLAAEKLCVTALVREPMARMQSHMYYGAENKDQTSEGANQWARQEYDVIPATYEEAMEVYPQLPPMTQMGLYGYQMKDWLREFNPKRMVIMPMMWAMDNQEDAVNLINSQCHGVDMNASAVANMPDNAKHQLNSGFIDNQPQNGLVFHKDIVADFRRKLFDQDEEVLYETLSAYTPGIAIGGMKSGVHHSTEDIKQQFRHHWGAKDYGTKQAEDWAHNHSRPLHPRSVKD